MTGGTFRSGRYANGCGFGSITGSRADAAMANYQPADSTERIQRFDGHN